jgi:putative isomerase
MTDTGSAFLEVNREKLTSRDADLLQRAVKTLCGNTVAPDGNPWSPHRGIIPSAGTYRGVWNWDAAFHALAVSRWDAELAWEQLSIFIESQLEEGAYVDVLFSTGEVVKEFGKPPVWPWALDLIRNRTPAVGELEKAYESFVRLEQHWVNNRSHDGMFHYNAETLGSDWLQNVKFESGWDNSVRWDNGIVELWPIDLNSYMVMFYTAMERMGACLDRDVAGWAEKKTELITRIEATLWDDRLGAYIDFNYELQRFTGILTPASFVPLFAGFAPPERALRMAELAAHPSHFYPGMPTVSYMNAGYSNDMWRGPCWLNTAYFALKGLHRYGHVEVAGEIRETILEWCELEPHLREYYDAKTGEGLNAVDFGWTAAFLIELILDWT